MVSLRAGWSVRLTHLPSIRMIIIVALDCCLFVHSRRKLSSTNVNKIMFEGDLFEMFGKLIWSVTFQYECINGSFPKTNRHFRRCCAVPRNSWWQPLQPVETLRIWEPSALECSCCPGSAAASKTRMPFLAALNAHCTPICFSALKNWEGQLKHTQN